MTKVRPAILPALLPTLLLGAGLAACAPYPADPYLGAAPVAPGYVAAPAPGYGSSYAAPMPALIGQGEYRGRGYGQAPAYAAAPVDSYCREAYAAAAGAQQEAAITGTYEAAARAGRADGFYRRDC